MSVYQPVLEFLVRIGFLDIIAPFFIVYIFVYSALTNSQVLGEYFEDKSPNYETRKRSREHIKRIYVLVSFVISFLFISSVGRSFTLIKIISLLVLSVIMAMMAFMVFHLIMPERIEKLRRNNYFLWIPTIIVALIFYVSLGLSKIWPLRTLMDYIINPATFLLIIFIGGLYLLTKDSTSSSIPSNRETESKPETTKLQVPGETLDSNKTIQDLDAPDYDSNRLSNMFEGDTGYYDPVAKEKGIEKFVSKDEHDRLQKQLARKNIETSNVSGPLHPKGKYKKFKHK